MRRVIVDFKKLNKDILNLLVQKFPDGYADRDIISFKNHHNELIEAVEVRTEDTAYLVKISKTLSDTMQAFDDDDTADNIPENVGAPEVKDMEGAEE